MPSHADPRIDAARRTFLARAGLAAAGVALGARPAPARSAATPPAAQRRLFSAYGITAPITRAVELKAAGADYLVEHVADALMPDAPDAAFERHRELVAAAVLPVRGCNVFLRPGLHCTGPDADHAPVLAFADTAFRRLARLGGTFIGLGSSASRQIPDGWPRARADEQYTALLRAMAPLAARHGITVSVEAQRSAEVNYLNHVAEIIAIVRAVDHPNIRVLADCYHMAVMEDPPADVAAARGLVGLVEIAEKANRTLPGVAGDDFRPWFRALATAGYSGPITIEGDGTPEQIRRAFTVIDAQSREALAAATNGADE